MKLLHTLRESEIFPGNQDIDNESFKIRLAARSVALDENGRVALLKVNKHNYHKLPGGGVEEGEDILQALSRELMEEIGCEADVISEIGEIIEYRDQWELKQTSHCYLAKKTGEQRPSAFDAGEVADEFEVYWANSIDSAINILMQDEPANYDGKFIQKRDLMLLNAAKALT